MFITLLKNKRPNYSKGIFIFFIFLLAFVILISPSRFFQTFSLVQAENNININYMNVVDLLCITEMILIFCFFRTFKTDINYDSKNYKTLSLTTVVCFSIFSLALLFSGNEIYVFEVVSKTIIILCALVFSLFIVSYNVSKPFIVFIFSFLFVICLAPIFLKNYLAYDEIHRAGSLGFFVNETGMFCCMLVAVSLFAIKKKYILRILFTGLGVYVSYLSGSRRGLILSVLIVIIFLLYSYVALLIKHHKKKVAFSVILVSGVSVLSALSLFFVLKYDYLVNNIPALYRLIHSAKDAGTILGKDRALLYQYVFAASISHPILGSYGSESLASVTILSQYSHAHNLFIQLFICYGFFFGFIFSLFFILVLIVSCRNIFTKQNELRKATSLIFFIYFLFDMLGYGLWNPKLLFLIMVCSIYVLNDSYLIEYFSKKKEMTLCLN